MSLGNSPIIWNHVILISTNISILNMTKSPIKCYVHITTGTQAPRQGLTDQISDVVEKREISTIVYTCYFPLTGKYKAHSEEFLNRK